MPNNNNGPSFIESMGQQAASEALGGIMGLFIGKHNDKRQISQQEKLQKLQIAGQKEMTDYNMSKQLEMWNATNYKAQMEKLREAGLNPGLIYGMSGGGATTVGNASGNVSSGAAPSGGGEIMAGMGMGLQMATQRAQLELMEAQADNLRADAENKRGIERDVAGATVGKLSQDIEESKQKQALMKVEENLKRIDETWGNNSMKTRLTQLETQTNIAVQQLNILRNDAVISENTWMTKIDMIFNEAAGIVLRNAQTEASTKLTQAQTDKIAFDIQAKIRELSQKDRELSQRDRELLIQETRNDLIETGIWVGAASNIAGNLVDIFTRKSKAMKGMTTMDAEGGITEKIFHY